MVATVTGQGAGNRNVGAGGSNERAGERPVATGVHTRARLGAKTEELGDGTGGTLGGTWHGGERQGRQVAAQWSTRVGIRLRWWIEKAKGGDASGPMSVGTGATHEPRLRD